MEINVKSQLSHLQADINRKMTSKLAVYISPVHICTKCLISEHDGRVEPPPLAHPALSCCGQTQVKAFSQEKRDEPSVSSLGQ